MVVVAPVVGARNRLIVSDDRVGEGGIHLRLCRLERRGQRAGAVSFWRGSEHSLTGPLTRIATGLSPCFDAI